MKVLEISSGTAAACAGLLVCELGFNVDRIDIDPRHATDDEDDEKAHDIFFHRGKNLIGPEDIDVVSYEAVIEDCGRQTLKDLGLSYTSIR